MLNDFKLISEPFLGPKLTFKQSGGQGQAGRRPEIYSLGIHWDIRVLKTIHWDPTKLGRAGAGPGPAQDRDPGGRVILTSQGRNSPKFDFFVHLSVVSVHISHAGYLDFLLFALLICQLTNDGLKNISEVL